MPRKPKLTGPTEPVTQYELPEPSEAQRLHDFTQHTEPGLGRELGAARFLLNLAMKKKQGGLSSQFLKVIGNLEKQDHEIKKQERLVLGRAEIVEIAGKMVTIMLDEVDLLDCSQVQKDRLTNNLLRRVEEAITGESKEPPPAQIQLPAPIVDVEVVP
jgi:hypothetical protein